MATSGYDSNVFINCPFDDAYKRIFDAVIFAVHDCGFIAKSAREVKDAGKVRITAIVRMIGECGRGIHDLSRTDLDKKNALPRFNMPLELGIFLGAQWLGTHKQRKKLCLVLDSEEYRYRKFCSDIAGQEVTPHNDDPRDAIKAVRNWLRASKPTTSIPGGRTISGRFDLFNADLPLSCALLSLAPEELTFADYRYLVVRWLQANPW